MKKKTKILAEGEDEEQHEEVGEKQLLTTTEEAVKGPVNYLDIAKEEEKEEEEEGRNRKTPQPIEESNKWRIFSLMFSFLI